MLSKTSAIILALTLSGTLARSVSAQQRPSPAAELALGALMFADDIVVTEGLVGGTTRFYVSPRISVGPEIAFIQGERHSHLMLTGNLTVDLVTPRNGTSAVVTPFIVAGAGLFRTRELFPGNDVFSSNEGAFTAGGGVRALVGDRILVGAEARIGWELHIRLNGLVGVRF